MQTQEIKQKELKDVNLTEEDAYLNTAFGRMKIDRINRSDWWVTCGTGWNQRSFSCHPHEIVEVTTKTDQKKIRRIKEEYVELGGKMVKVTTIQ
ncbi:MAG: hypothetical protein AB1349_01755 [Elusimicrobiota bacterium]